MDRGDLVPDEVTVAMVAGRLQEDDAQAGFLLDGFPRNVPQAETLQEDARRLGRQAGPRARAGGRRRRGGQAAVRAADLPPVRPGLARAVRPAGPRRVCDDCGGELFQRDDDREETIRHRLEVYQQQTQPLIAFYADEGILLGIDATGPVEEITDRALGALRRFVR